MLKYYEFSACMYHMYIMLVMINLVPKKGQCLDILDLCFLCHEFGINRPPQGP
jgi:hypothetical protein